MCVSVVRVCYAPEPLLPSSVPNLKYPTIRDTWNTHPHPNKGDRERIRWRSGGEQKGITGRAQVKVVGETACSLLKVGAHRLLLLHLPSVSEHVSESFHTHLWLEQIVRQSFCTQRQLERNVRESFTLIHSAMTGTKSHGKQWQLEQYVTEDFYTHSETTGTKCQRKPSHSKTTGTKCQRNLCTQSKKTGTKCLKTFCTKSKTTGTKCQRKLSRSRQLEQNARKRFPIQSKLIGAKYLGKAFALCWRILE